MDHRLYHAVRPPLTIRQSPPQRIYRLVVVAGDIGRIAQQLRRQSLRTGRVHHVPRRQLVAVSYTHLKNNPRAKVDDIYDQVIFPDLDKAEELLSGFTAPDKYTISRCV